MNQSRWNEIHTRGDVPKHAMRIHEATAGVLAEREEWPTGEVPQVDQMRWARWVQAEAAQLVEASVIEARAEGVAWSTIGEVHGITRQSAQQRFGHLQPAFRKDANARAARARDRGQA